MSVISFIDYVPLPRYDGKKWAQVKIEEAATSAGPWSVIETLVLAPLDADPAQPQARNITTENATLDQGWYRLVFIDETGDEQLPTAPIQNVPDDEDPLLPTVHDVGTLERARTTNRAGQQLGTFTPNTIPTQDEVLAVIRQAGRDVRLKVGADIPAEFLKDARQLVALRAAMLIELSYFPEQVAANNSPYDRYKVLYDEALPSLVQAVADAEGEDTDIEGTGGMPHFGFPENKGGMVGWGTRW